MLVLTRKPGESIIIDGRIKVFVVESKGGAVKLSIDAPGNVPIYRGELLEKILKSNRMAATTDIGALNGLADTLKKKK